MSKKIFAKTPVVILAGGFGTRLSEETYLKPKPMIKIGNMPMIMHIIKFYSSYGFKNFIILLGYKGEYIKRYFYKNKDKNNYYDVFQNKNIDTNVIPNKLTINLIKTGLHTQTGGRLKKIKDYINNDIFCMTYGDGLSDVNLNKLYKSHIESKKLATVTAVPPPSRFGYLRLDKKNRVIRFEEKPKPSVNSKEWINGGFFILSKKVIKYIINDNTKWEEKPLKKLSEKNELNAYKHVGFWQPVDTLREKKILNEIWKTGKAPWENWKIKK